MELVAQSNKTLERVLVMVMLLLRFRRERTFKISAKAGFRAFRFNKTRLIADAS
jgi:hypothetical protein